MTSDTKRKLQGFAGRSRHYFENALSFLRDGEVEKSSELLWGSMAEAVKAVAMVKERAIRSHGELRRYAAELAKELNDEMLYDAFMHANSLHSNFYESHLTAQEVEILAGRVRGAVRKLLDLIPVEFLQEGTNSC